MCVCGGGCDLPLEELPDQSLPLAHQAEALVDGTKHLRRVAHLACNNQWEWHQLYP